MLRRLLTGHVRGQLTWDGHPNAGVVDPHDRHPDGQDLAAAVVARTDQVELGSRRHRGQQFARNGDAGGPLGQRARDAAVGQVACRQHGSGRNRRRQPPLGPVAEGVVGDEPGRPPGSPDVVGAELVAERQVGSRDEHADRRAPGGDRQACHDAGGRGERHGGEQDQAQPGAGAEPPLAEHVERPWQRGGSAVEAQARERGVGGSQAHKHTTSAAPASHRIPPARCG